MEAKAESSDESLVELHPPNHTLYLNNLNESVKLNDLTHVLEQVFSQFGNVLQVVAKAHLRMKGQAFIVYDNLESAAQALDQLQGKVLFDKKMRLNYALELSDVIAKREGKPIVPRVQKEIKKKKDKKEKKTKKNAEPAEQMQQQLMAQSLAPQSTSVVTNKILFVEELPSYIDQDILNEIFGSYQGFLEVRLIAAKAVAFVEFHEEFQAMVALNELNNKSITSEFTLRLSFAKK